MLKEKKVKKAIFSLILALAACVPALAQSGPSVNLTWTASPSATASNPGTVNVYRATVAAGASCPVPSVSSAYTLLSNAPGASTGSLTDASVTWNTTYCYALTAVISGMESTSFSNAAQAVIPVQPPIPSPPGTLAVTVTL